MNKDEIFIILKELNLPKKEFYIISGASLVIRGIREKCADIDLCISERLFEEIKDIYGLTEDKKNKYGFYQISDIIEVVVEKKENFKMEELNPYNLEDLHTILDYKEKRNLLKDQVDIKNINKYLEKLNNVKMQFLKYCKNS